MPERVLITGWPGFARYPCHDRIAYGTGFFLSIGRTYSYCQTWIDLICGQFLIGKLMAKLKILFVFSSG
jgi:hypothetical protein